MSNSLIPVVYGAEEDCRRCRVSAANVDRHLAIVNSISDYLSSRSWSSGAGYHVNVCILPLSAPRRYDAVSNSDWVDHIIFLSTTRQGQLNDIFRTRRRLTALVPTRVLNSALCLSGNLNILYIHPHNNPNDTCRYRRHYYWHMRYLNTTTNILVSLWFHLVCHLFQSQWYCRFRRRSYRRAC